MKERFKAIILTFSTLLFMPSCLAVSSDQLQKLDAQRNDFLKQVVNELSYGHMTLVDAQKLKTQLDEVVTLENAYKIGQVQLVIVSTKLNKVHNDIKAATHAEKVWLGIDSHSKVLRKKIDNAFAAGKLTKEEAENLGREEQILRDRETVNDASAGLEFDDAIAIAKQAQQLDKKIDDLSKK